MGATAAGNSGAASVVGAIGDSVSEILTSLPIGSNVQPSPAPISGAPVPPASGLTGQTTTFLVIAAVVVLGVFVLFKVAK